jgi:putative Mg2+ transporter-C (MgtC) family protein
VVSEVEMLARLVLAVVLGALIGLDRETRDKPAGLRTFAIVSLGACIFTLVGEMAFTGAAETSRVVSTIITGVGFLGAGTIIQRRSGVLGLTTAAGIWASAGIGMAAGIGLYTLAVGGTVLIVAVFWLLGWLADRVPKRPDHDGVADDEASRPKDRRRRERPEDVAKGD